MSQQKSIPTYRQQKQSGKAIVILGDGLGTRQDILLGAYGSAESRVRARHR
jgi:hypothetical protein